MARLGRDERPCTEPADQPHQRARAGAPRFSPAGGNAGIGKLGVAAKRTSTALWTRSDGTNSIAQTRRIAPNGTLRPVRTLSAAGQSVTQLELAVAPNGVSTALWARSDGSVSRIQSRRVAANGAVAAVQNRSAPGQPASDPTIAAGPTGIVFMAWRRLNRGLFDIAQALRITPRGATGTVKNVSKPGRNTNDLDIAVSRAGTATLAWYSNDGTKDVVQAARYRP